MGHCVEYFSISFEYSGSKLQGQELCVGQGRRGGDMQGGLAHRGGQQGMEGEGCVVGRSSFFCV